MTPSLSHTHVDAFSLIRAPSEHARSKPEGARPGLGSRGEPLLDSWLRMESLDGEFGREASKLKHTFTRTNLLALWLYLINHTIK